MQQIYETGLRPSAFKSVLATTSDPDLAAMGEAGVNAIPMPNIPEMGSVWSAWNNGISIALTGRVDPRRSHERCSRPGARPDCWRPGWHGQPSRQLPG